MDPLFPKPLKTTSRNIADILTDIDKSGADYPKEIIEIEGIVSLKGQFGSYTLVNIQTFNLLLWKRSESDYWVEDDLYVMRPVYGMLNSNDIKPFSIVKIKVYLSNTQKRAIIVSGEIMNPEISIFKDKAMVLRLPKSGIKPYDFSPNEFIPTSPQITLNDISDFEKQIGCSLPEDYVNFLLKYNGCKLKHKKLQIIEPDILTPHPNGYKSNTTIFEFYDLEKLKQSFNDRNEIKWAVNEWVTYGEDKEFIYPDDVVAIADAHIHILYAFKGLNQGRTYYYHHENLCTLSDSFEELLQIISASFSSNDEEFEEVESKLNLAIEEGNFENFKTIIEEFNGYEILLDNGYTLREVTHRLLVYNPNSRQESIQGYERFVDYLESRNLISYEATEKWLKQYG